MAKRLSSPAWLLAAISILAQFLLVLPARAMGSKRQTASASDPGRPIVFLIPGSGSSGDRIYLSGFNWAAPIFGGDAYFGRFQRELGGLGIQNEVCPQTRDRDRRSLEQRASECVSQILASRAKPVCESGSKRDVILLGHSMGGLVARLVADDPSVSECIQSVTTVSTPHRGTPLADFAIEHAEDSEARIDLYGILVRLIQFVPEHLRYLSELRTDRSFVMGPGDFSAQDAPDQPGVQYFSISGSMRHIPILPLAFTGSILRHQIIARKLDQTSFGARNDGIVPEYSMVHGQYLGHLEGHHWSSACLDPVKRSRECASALRIILPHLEGLVAQAE